VAIKIICGEPGVGKTSLMAYLANTELYNRIRYRKSANAIMIKKRGGFNYSLPENHVVYSNFHVLGKRWGYHRRTAFTINPAHLGFVDFDNLNKFVHFLPPYSAIFITEGQEYFNARKWVNFSDYQSRFYERHRHNNYDIWIDVQRYDLIDINIRELCEVIEIQSKRDIQDRYGKVIGQEWIVRRFETALGFRKYRESGNVLKNYKQDKIKSDVNVHEVYDSHGCEPDFFRGHMNSDFCQEVIQPPAQTYESYANYFNKGGSS